MYSEDQLIKEQTIIYPKGSTRRKKLPIKLDLFFIALIIFSFLFVSFTLITGIWLVDWNSTISIVYFFGFVLLYIGIAFDLTEIILSIWNTPQDIPKSPFLTHSPAVALLMTICDDANTYVLRQLKNQNYSNYDIYILDDSFNEMQQEIINQTGYKILRRGNRRGYKAGNLNHWLDKYGKFYKYMIVLDSDSLLPDNFITCMVEYAEHPLNRQVALFQSKIIPWNTHLSMPRMLGALAPMRMHILDRIANRMGTMLSWGHNNLTRLEVLLDIGGFQEHLTSEDTTLSLLLSARGYSIKLVDVISYDSEPNDLHAYTRRGLRWAQQTTALFHYPWQSASIKLKMFLCYQLYGYVLPYVYLTLLMMAAWMPVRNVSLNWQYALNFIFESRYYLSPWFFAVLIMTGLWIIQILARFVFAYRAGVSVHDFIFHYFFSASLMYFTVFPIGLAILETLILGNKISFVPTNSVLPQQNGLRKNLYQMIPLFIYGGMLFAGLLLKNRYLLFSLNGLPIILLFLAPLTLRYFLSSQESFQEVSSEL